MPTGKVKFFDSEKGFGFVSGDAGEGDVFVPASALPEGVAGLKGGQRIEFSIAEGRRGAQALSVSLQVAVFRTTRRRLFRMAPFHHHFELSGWAETTVIIRFWLMAGVCCMIGLGLFYSEWLGATGGLGQ